MVGLFDDSEIQNTQIPGILSYGHSTLLMPNDIDKEMY